MDRIAHGCGITGMLSLEPGSVDLVLTDPPSGDTSAPFDTKIDVVAFWQATWRALKPAGVEGHRPLGSNRKGRGASLQASQGANYGRAARASAMRTGETTRYPRSVLHFAGVSTNTSDRIHSQQKPQDKLEYLVATYSNPGELVVDPFAGSGSTMAAALALGRRCRSWELRREFVRKANRRLAGKVA